MGEWTTRERVWPFSDCTTQRTKTGSWGRLMRGGRGEDRGVCPQVGSREGGEERPIVTHFSINLLPQRSGTKRTRL